MIRSLFFSIGDANKLANRPKGVPTQAYTRIGILGAGMMGAGIAWAASSAGLNVVLPDSTPESADKGKAYTAGLLDKRNKAKNATEADKEKQHGLIIANTRTEDRRVGKEGVGTWSTSWSQYNSKKKKNQKT